MSPRGAGYLFGSDVVTQVKLRCANVVVLTSSVKHVT